MTYGTHKSHKVKKAKSWKAVKFQTEKRIQKGEQKVIKGIDKTGTTFGEHRLYQRQAFD